MSSGELLKPKSGKLVPLQRAQSCHDQNFHICIFLVFAISFNYSKTGIQKRNCLLRTVWKYIFYGNPEKILNSFKAAINLKSRVPNAHILRLNFSPLSSFKSKILKTIIFIFLNKLLKTIINTCEKNLWTWLYSFLCCNYLKSRSNTYDAPCIENSLKHGADQSVCRYTFYRPCIPKEWGIWCL